MLKSELKTGMWLELRNGDIRIVMLGTALGDYTVSHKATSWGKLDYINDDLTSNSGKDYDIMKVYMPMYRNSSMEFNASNCDILFTRNDNSKEIAAIKKTIEDAEKSLKDAKQKLVELEG